jgi:hypothetical protein
MVALQFGKRDCPQGCRLGEGASEGPIAEQPWVETEKDLPLSSQFQVGFLSEKCKHKGRDHLEISIALFPSLVEILEFQKVTLQEAPECLVGHRTAL